MTEHFAPRHHVHPPAFTPGSVRRRQLTVVVLLTGLAIGAMLTVVTPMRGFIAFGFFMIALIVDLALLRRRRVLLAERSMVAAFRSRRPRRTIR